jgi:hypothetical protein
MCIFFTGGKFASLYRSSGKKTAGTKNSASLISVLCSWHKTKGHICQYRQSFMEWLNLEGIGDKKKKKILPLRQMPPANLPFQSPFGTWLSN